MDDQSKDYDPTPVKTDIPAIGITLQYPLDEGLGRSLVFQTFVAADCPQSELNGALDKVRIAADRQRAIAMLPTLKGMLSDKEDMLKLEAEKYLQAQTTLDHFNNRVDIVATQEGRRKPAGLSAQQAGERARIQQQLDQPKQTIEQIKRAIVIDKRKVADAEALIKAGD